MKNGGIKLVAIVTLAGCAVLALMISNKMADSKNELTSTGRGSVEHLLANYKDWEAAYIKNGGDRNMVLPIGPFKGLSTESSNAHGQAILNLIEGTVSVEVSSLPKGETWDIWLVENRARSSVMPEAGDIMVRVGNLKQKGGTAKLEIALGAEAFAKFEPDLITITRAGKSPAEDRLLVGTTTLFHRLYRNGKRGHFGTLNDDEPAREASSKRLWNWLVASVSPTAYAARIGPHPDPQTRLEHLIAAGRQSFFNDTFRGNGRTCGTCHRENRNLTIDPEFIATLPPNDPLFVAEFIPALAVDFEKPELMRKFGLILENVDGFLNPGVMRGVPHTLALLQNTLSPANILPFPDGTTTPPNERTGWGGDGAPGTGTLREFIIGAITQHYPKRLNRVPGVDFILPTVAQMDALEAFMKSSGRREDLVLTGPDALSLKSEIAAKGQQLFNDPSKGKCFACHLNAGASVDGVHNANFNTNVEGLPNQPARLVDAAIPIDGGFGRNRNPDGSFGNRTFNTTVLVESADTGPFFHNNSIRTIEGAVAFYNSAAFNSSPGALGLAFIPDSQGPGIQLETTEVEAVAAFLRVINVLENFRSTEDLLNRAKRANYHQLKELLNLALAEIDDAYRVLVGGGLHPETQLKIQQIAALVEAAIKTPGKSYGLIAQALRLYEKAESELRK